MPVMYRAGAIAVIGGAETPPNGAWLRLIPYAHPLAYPWWSPTTRAVLEALTRGDVEGRTVLDYGCGASAILGLAAYAFGASCVHFAECKPDLLAIAEQQIKANGQKPRLDDETLYYDFALANLGDAFAIGILSKRTAHGLGTDKEGRVIRW